MGKADRFTEMELDYIRAVYPQVGPTEIARKLGRSKSAVKARAKQMGLTAGGAGKDGDGGPAEAGGGDTLSRLRETRDILRMQMPSAPPNALAGLCREYRAVLADIDRLEAEDGGGKPSALEELAAAIAGQVRP